MKITYAISPRGVLHWGYTEADPGRTRCGNWYRGSLIKHWEVAEVEAKKVTTAKNAKRIFRAEPCQRCWP